MKEYILTILISFREVFSKPTYILFSSLTFIFVLVFAIWLPNFRFLSHTAASNLFTFSEKFGIITSTLGGLQTNFTLLSRTLILLVSFLFAINSTFLVFYILRATRLSKSAGLGVSGFALGLIGIGCATCGSVILTALFGIGATAGFIHYLPLKGQEFGIISIAILSFSIYLLASKIKDPLVCNAKPFSFRSLFKMPSWSKLSLIIIFTFITGIFVAILRS